MASKNLKRKGQLEETEEVDVGSDEIERPSTRAVMHTATEEKKKEIVLKKKKKTICRSKTSKTCSTPPFQYYTAHTHTTHIYIHINIIYIYIYNMRARVCVCMSV